MKAKSVKKGRYANPGVRCPFYKYQNYQIIFCKGIKEGQSFQLSFDDRGKRADWQREFCGLGNRRAEAEGDFRNCEVYQMILRHEEAE